MPLGSSSPGTAGAAVTPWGWHQPWQLVGNATVVREGGSGWERPGDAPGCRRCSWLQENFPAAGESLSCRRIFQLQEMLRAAGESPSCRISHLSSPDHLDKAALLLSGHSVSAQENLSDNSPQSSWAALPHSRARCCSVTAFFSPSKTQPAAKPQLQTGPETQIKPGLRALRVGSSPFWATPSGQTKQPKFLAILRIFLVSLPKSGDV